jgi:hypothetical protein
MAVQQQTGTSGVRHDRIQMSLEVEVGLEVGVLVGVGIGLGLGVVTQMVVVQARRHRYGLH